VTYAYDANIVNSACSQYIAGRLATAQYSVCAPGHPATLTEMYSYHPAGTVMAKQLQVHRCGYDGSGNFGCGDATMKASYSYDAAGRMASYGTATPSANGSPSPVYTYGYDGMGRPVSLTDNAGALYPTASNGVWVQNVQYDFAGRRSFESGRRGNRLMTLIRDSIQPM
jgi:hypothetical protein